MRGSAAPERSPAGRGNGAAERGIAAAVRVALVLALAAAPLSARKFYPDDPLQKEPPPLPVGKLPAIKINDYFDFIQNTFAEPDKDEIKHGTPPPSEAVNTLGEVPDNSWVTNRIGTLAMSLADLVRGPGDAHSPSREGPWIVLSGKTEGVSPGMVIRDSAGRKYFVKFDPMSNPEMATAADVLGSKFFYDLGYNTPENYIIIFKRGRLTVAAESRFRDVNGHNRAMTNQDIDDILKRVPRYSDGSYRGIASLEISGRLIGPFRYHGTRSDDPNDIVDHENRRDLRGLYVFAAWLNHTDCKSINSMDSVVDDGGIPHVRHYLLDFGAILGSDSIEPKSPRAGHEYMIDPGPAGWQMLSLGLLVPAWMRADFPHLPEVGRLDYKTFDPEHWKSNYPNPAFGLRTPGDTYWAAKKVMAFSERAIRAIVETGEYSDPRAVDWIVKCLVERRDRIGRAFFSDVLPLDNFAVWDGMLLFEDLAVKYGFRGARRYSVAWSEFDNATGGKRRIPRAGNFEVPRSAASYLAAEIRGEDPRKRVTVYLHDGRVVGVDRTW